MGDAAQVSTNDDCNRGEDCEALQSGELCEYCKRHECRKDDMVVCDCDEVETQACARDN